MKRWGTRGIRDIESTVTDGQQPVVCLPTPSVYFHITSINCREQKTKREMEREKMNTLMRLVLTPCPDMSS